MLLEFVCQAEDGIRDLVRSRGLGDVYKRQVLGSLFGGWAWDGIAIEARVWYYDAAHIAGVWFLSLIHI